MSALHPFAVIFPGQGSQHPGMGKYLYDQFKIAQLVFEESSDALRKDMKKLCFEGSDQDLALTENTQPALVTVSTATWKCLREETGVAPIAFAGHSVGEYSALVAAGAIGFQDAVRAVKLRGQEMQKAVPVGEGGMCAVMGLQESQVLELCKVTVEKLREETQAEAVLSPANFNAPGQVVISGHLNAIQFLRDKIKTEIYPEELRKTKLIPLNVSAPFIAH